MSIDAITSGSSNPAVTLIVVFISGIDFLTAQHLTCGTAEGLYDAF